jgi:hypothetical protein
MVYPFSLEYFRGDGLSIAWREIRQAITNPSGNRIYQDLAEFFA